MKYTKETLKTKQVKFTIDLDHNEWEEMLNHVYEHQKSKYRVEGFRQGKAPRKVIESQYGESVFYNDALNEAFYHHFGEVLDKEKEIEMVGNPSLDVTKLDSTGLTLTVVIDVKPEVKLGSYKGLKVEKEAPKVSAEEVKTELNKMLEKSSRMVSVDKEAKLGDTVVIDFTGMKDGVAFEGGHAEKHNLELGSGSFIPGFEDACVGIKKGEDRDINVSFPAEYPVEELKGQPVVFKIHCHEVREKQTPKMDDEWAKNVSEFNTLDEYKESVKKDLLKAKEREAEYKFEEKLIDTIVSGCEVEIPQSMVEEQLDMYIHDFEHQLSHYGLKLEDYVKNYMKSSVEELRNSKVEDAKKTCKTRLVLEAITKAENLKVENEDIEDAIKKQAVKLGTDVEEVKKGLDEHMLSHMANDILIEKLLKLLKDNN